LKLTFGFLLFQPYEEGEEVLVETKSKVLLWDATVTAVSRRRIDDSFTKFLIDAYRVRYKGWNSRFVEWVRPCRVVEPNENNRLLQVSNLVLNEAFY